MLADVVIFTMQTVFFRDGILEIIIGLCLNVIGAIAAFVVLQQIALHIQWEKNGFFNILSHCTMPMYLFHQQLIYMSISAFNGVVNPYVNALINFGISFGLSFIMSNVFLRFKWTRLMIGGTFNGRNKTRRL
jgi:hypothetical protein